MPNQIILGVDYGDKKIGLAIASAVMAEPLKVVSSLEEVIREIKDNDVGKVVVGVSEGEAAETQVWLEFAEACEYIPPLVRTELEEKYEKILGMLVNMVRNPDKWKV